MMSKSPVLVSASRWSWVFIWVPVNTVRLLPQGGHQCDVCHNVSDAKVNIRKLFGNNTKYQCNYEGF